MGKDPAVLFYTSDFITGTLTMTDEQRGKYILLLCLQHQKGTLTEKDMLNICKTYDKDIFEKFRKDDNGNYFNERMKSESMKRSEYSLSRSNNRKSKNICKTYVKHMENENENEIENINNKKGIIPLIEEVKAYCKERNNSVNPDQWYNFYSAKGWMIGKNKMKDWKAAVRTWEKESSSQEKSIYEKYIPDANRV